MLPRNISIADLKPDRQTTWSTFVLAAYMTVISSLAVLPESRSQKLAALPLSPPQEPFQKSAQAICFERAVMLSAYISQIIRPETQPSAAVLENENDPPPPPVKKRFPRFDATIIEPLCLLAKHFSRDDIKALATVLVESGGHPEEGSSSSNAVGLLQYLPVTYAQAVREQFEGFIILYPEKVLPLVDLLVESETFLRYYDKTTQKTLPALQRKLNEKKAEREALSKKLKDEEAKLHKTKKVAEKKLLEVGAVKLREQLKKKAAEAAAADAALKNAQNELGARLREYSQNQVSEERLALTIPIQIFDYLAKGRDYVAHFAGDGGARRLRNMAAGEPDFAEALKKAGLPENWKTRQSFTVKSRLRRTSITIALPPPAVRGLYPALHGMTEEARSNASVYFNRIRDPKDPKKFLYIPRLASEIIGELEGRVTKWSVPLGEWMKIDPKKYYICPPPPDNPVVIRFCGDSKTKNPELNAG